MASKPDTLGRMLDSSGKIESAYVGDLILTDLNNVNVVEGTQQVGDNLGWDVASASMQIMNLTDTTNLKTTAEVDTAIGSLLGTPPASLDTLSEFQTAIGNNTDFGTQFTTIQARTKAKHFIADGTQTEFDFLHEAGKVHVSINGVQMTSQQQAGLLAPAITHDYTSVSAGSAGPPVIGPKQVWSVGSSSYDNNARVGLNYGSEADAKADFQNVGVFDAWHIYSWPPGWQHENEGTEPPNGYKDVHIFSGTNIPDGSGVDDGYNFNGDYTWRGWAAWDIMDVNLVLYLHPQPGDTVGQTSGQPYEWENYKNSYGSLSTAQRRIAVQPAGGGGSSNVTSGEAAKIAFTSLVPEAGDIVTIRSY